MRRSLVALLAWLGLTACSLAQAPTPANMGLIEQNRPNVLQVLDSSKTWATIGTVDPTTHQFIATSVQVGGILGLGAGVPLALSYPVNTKDGLLALYNGLGNKVVDTLGVGINAPAGMLVLGPNGLGPGVQGAIGAPLNGPYGLVQLGPSGIGVGVQNILSQPVNGANGIFGLGPSGLGSGVQSVVSQPVNAPNGIFTVGPNGIGSGIQAALGYPINAPNGLLTADFGGMGVNGEIFTSNGPGVAGSFNNSPMPPGGGTINVGNPGAVAAYTGANAVLAPLPYGKPQQVLRSNGTGVPPTFQDANLAYTSHALLLAGAAVPSTSGAVIEQSGFYAAGDGGAATYAWSATSYCLGGTSGAPVTADGLVCILPSSQSSSAAGRYLLQADTGIDVRQVGMQPGGFDNSPLVPALMEVVASSSIANLVNHTPEIVFPPILGQSSTSYYFSKSFINSRSSIIDCKTVNFTGFGGVTLVFPPGVDGVRQEVGYLTLDGGWGEDSVRGCGIESFGKAQGTVTPGTGNANNINFADDTDDIPNNTFFAAGDGVIVSTHFIDGHIIDNPGDTVGTADANTKTITLANGAVFKPMSDPVSQAIFYDLPASLAYTYQSTNGSSSPPIITAGPEVLKPGDMIWADAYLFGATVSNSDNHATAATVNSGGSGYSGTSGTMTYAGPECAGDGYSNPPVLNVAASGGVITGVTSVATAGECLRGKLPSPAIAWTPGGGLSGGSGAKFNVTFVQQPTLSSVGLNLNVPPAHVTHSAGSPGKLWAVPAGMVRRVQAEMRDGKIMQFPFGLRMDCTTGATPPVGCNSSFDERNTIEGALVGRLTRGNVTGVSASISNIYARNYVIDIAEMGTIGSPYFNDETVSVDNGTAGWAITGNCGIASPIFYSPYLSSGAASGYCLNPDADGFIGIFSGTNVQEQSSGLFIGPFYGAMTPSVNAGNLYGIWTINGYGAYTDTVVTATASGNVIMYPTSGVYRTGNRITDLTNPVIPANTTITAMWSGHIQLSNNLTGALQVGDQVQINGYGSSYNFVPGLAAQGAYGLQLTTTGVNNEYSIQPNGYLNSWDALGVHYPLGNYLGYNSGVPVFQGGLQVGSSQNYTGQERVIDSGSSAPSGGLPGDIHLNNQQSVGSNLAWVNTSLFNNYLNADLAVGATSVAVYNCPPATVTAGTPVIDTVSPPSNHIAVVAHVLGTFASCSGGVLHFQSGATSAGTHDDTIQYTQWRQAGRIANDPYGYSFIPSGVIDVATLLANVPCSVYPYGLSIVYNGDTVAHAGYNAPMVDVGGAGATPRLVFCDGTSWTYH